jgi:hypothetical protein
MRTNRAEIAFVLLLGIPAVSGCTTWAEAGVHKALIQAPATVNRGEKLFFTVTLQDAAGIEKKGVAFQWKVDWVGLEGMLHKGKSAVEQRINVKGTPGTAVLTIFGLNDQDEPVEIGKREFRVE